MVGSWNGLSSRYRQYGTATLLNKDPLEKMYGNTEMEDWRNCTERDAFARKSLIGLSFRGQFAELFGRNPEGQLRSFSEATWGESRENCADIKYCYDIPRETEIFD